MTDLEINKWLRRQFSPLGWGLVAYYALMNVVVSVAMTIDILGQSLHSLASGNSLPDIDTAALMDNGWGYIVANLVALVILYAWKGPDFCFGEVFARERKMKPGIFLALLAMCLGSQLVNSLWMAALEAVMNLFGTSALGILEEVSGATGSFSMFLYASILAPVVEELFFRGWILRSLRPYGKRFAILGSAVLFGLFHGNLLQTPYAFFVGLILGYVTVEYSILWAMGIHLFNNLVLADLLSRITASLPEMTANGITLGVLSAGAVASVIILLRKRLEIRIYRESEWIDRRCVKCFFLSSGILVLMLIMFGNMLLMLG
jgi:membrane protease YdiL (CAAX protease family)